MMRRISFVLALCAVLGAGPGATRADSCPQAKDHGVALARLIEAVRQAPDARQARLITNEMWALWADAPDEPAQALLDDGMTRRANYDLAGALKAFDRLVAYCPGYTEGYNQRAFVNFIRRDYEVALVDLDRALALTPTHLGALTGRAMTYIALGRDAEAQADLRVAVGLNPWLPERGMLKDPAPGAKDPDL